MPVLVTLGIVVAVFEAIEFTLLRDAPMRWVHLFHLLRGVSSSLVVSGVVAWQILKRSPNVLGDRQGELRGSPALTRDDPSQTLLHNRWFVAMRWVMLLFAGAAIFAAGPLLGWVPQEADRPLWVLLAGWAAFNIFCVYWSRQSEHRKRLLNVQGYVDLFVLTALLHFSGGLENPLFALMIFHIIVGGILLSRRHCYGLAACGSALFGLLIGLEWTGIIAHYHLAVFPHGAATAGWPAARPSGIYAISWVALQALLLFLAAYLVTTLAKRLRFNEMKMKVMALRAQADRQLLERALETTQTGLQVLNHELRSYWANRRWTDWFSGGDEVALVKDDVTQCLSTGRALVSEFSPQGDPEAARPPRRTFLITSAPLTDRQGAVQQVVQIAQDITSQKAAHAQLVRAGQLAALGELAGKIAHEINNPMAIIGAKASLLLSDRRAEISEKVSSELNKIVELSNRVARIAQGLLSYGRPSPARKAPIDLCGPIRHALGMIESHAGRSGVAIEDRLPERLPLILADAGEIEQVFLNLFLNAMDAMPHGGRLIVRLLRSPSSNRSSLPNIRVGVEDTGVGIPPEWRDKVFEPFFTTKKNGRGTGLGLSICQGLIRGHGGTLQMESQAGQGTVFTIQFPCPFTDQEGEPYAEKAHSRCR